MAKAKSKKSKKSIEERTYKAITEAIRDSIVFGRGVLRVDSDGSLRRIKQYVKSK